MQLRLSLLFLLCLGLLSPTLSAQQVGEEEYGLASYYSDDFQGSSTAYGEVYDKNKLTAAHKRFPFNSKIRVTRLDNQQSVVVRVIDQGPYIRGRVVDLSRRAASALGLIDAPATEVRVELLELPGSSATAARRSAERPAEFDQPEQPRTTTAPPPQREVTTTSDAADNRARQPEMTEKSGAAPAATAKPAPAKPAAASPAAPARPAAGQLYKGKTMAPGLYKIEIRKPEVKGWGVQVASLSNYDNLMQQITSLQARWFDNILVSIEPASAGQGTYKVILGPFSSEKVAQQYEKDLKRKYNINGFTVNLDNITY